MKKKLFACAMALVMLLSLLPTAALAVEDVPAGPMLVAAVDVLFDEPAAGAAVPAVTVAEDAAYALYSATWYDKNGDPVVELADGQRYSLNVAVVAKEGYVLSGDTMAMVNGTPVDNYWYEEDEQVSMVRICVDVSFCQKIAEAEIFYDEPVAGAALSAVTIPEGAPYTVADAVWSDLHTGDVATEAVVGSRYQLYVQLLPAEGYEFAEDVYVLVNGSEDFSGLGYYWDMVEIYNEVSFCQTIDTAEVTLDAPVVGQPLPVPTVAEDAPYTVADVNWYDDMTEGGDAPTVAEDGHRYEVNIMLQAKQGYEFGDETVVLLNGEDAENYWCYGENADIYLTFSFKKTVDEVEISYDAPEAGKAAPAVTIPDGVNYVLESAVWFDDDTSEEATELLDGHSYSMYVTLRPAAGYEFSEDAAVVVNGEATEDCWVFTDAVEIYGKASFKKTIDKVELPAPPADLQAGDSLEVGLGETDDHYSVVVAWSAMDDNMDEAELGDTAEAGKNYLWMATAIPDEGYAFAEDVTVTVGGKAVKTALYMEMESAIMVGQLYLLGDVEMIDKVELTTTLPAVGEAVGSAEVDEDAPYELAETNWAVSETDDMMDAMEAPYEEGMKVWLAADLMAKEGYIFSPELEVYVNGELANTDFFNPIIYASGSVVYSPNEAAVILMLDEETEDEEIIPGGGDEDKEDAPLTGDEGVMLYAVLAVVTLAGAVVLLRKRRMA